MTDPYRVLGISRDASEDDIKKAYRALSRKYHPDANINNPNKDVAEEKFKEIQEAYNRIMDERQNGGSSFGGYGNSYGGNAYGYRNSYQEDYTYSQASMEMQAAANYINARQFAQAMNVLHSIDDSLRNGQWYFFAAVASQGMGNINDAREYIRRAIALEPGNFRYRQFQQSIDWSNNWYEYRGHSYGYTRPYTGVVRWCASMIILNLLCNICCFF